MRLITYALQNQIRLGAVVARHNADYVLDFSRAQLPTSMIELLQADETVLATAKGVADSAAETDLVPLADVSLLAPIPRPQKIICVGHNYMDHLGKDRTEPPQYPNFFCKTANTIIGHQQSVVIPKATSQVDYEAELAVVIGKRARHLPQEKAYDYVAGYTIFNDVSARDYQNRTSQWMLGKSFDTFGPMGPALVTKDEIADPHALDLWLTLNGLEMQRANTRQMIFTIPYLISYLSQAMTLEVGDVIATGTPAKTGLARSLPPFMKASDVVKIGIQNLGELSNPLIAEA